MALVIKAVIFDIGGVVVGSPLQGIRNYEAAHVPPLPSDYINCSITDLGSHGAFQQLERGEIDYYEFTPRFGAEVSQVERGNKAYAKLCKKRGVECPPLPTEINVDGVALWTEMMTQATFPCIPVLNAINHLRQNPNLKLAALTNNFSPAGSRGPAPPPHVTLDKRILVSPKQLHAAFERSGKASATSTGAPVEELKGLFDVFVESAITGLRKPDPRIYFYTLEKLGVKPEESVFLDDIGHNLVAAKKLGMNTIQVKLGHQDKAVAELAKYVEMDLTKPIVYSDEKL